MLYFTSDTHFDHVNIIKHAHRPFSSIEEMNEVLIDNINKTVGVHDILWHLGDFAFGKRIDYFRNKINCKNVNLVLGNHDRANYQTYKEYFSYVTNFYELKIKEYHLSAKSITLCHYAMKVWNKSHYGDWHLYGHSHGSMPDDINSRSFDCGVDCFSYKPVSILEVAEIMNTKQFKPLDRHGT